MLHVRLSFMFTIIYMILNENVSLLTAGLGVASAVSAIFLTNKILEIDYVEIFHLNLWIVLAYFWIIIRDTYLVGFNVIIRTLKGDIRPNFINYRSDLKDELMTVLLANAITMPPGAITVDRVGNNMTILTVGFDRDEFRKATNEKVEGLLRRFDIDE